MVVWRYIDLSALTITILKDYYTMKRVSMLGERQLNNPINTLNIDLNNTINEQEHRAKIATEYLAWVGPAWNSLTPQERKILFEFYMRQDQRSGATKRLEYSLNYSERQIERMRKAALSRMQKLLLGE